MLTKSELKRQARDRHNHEYRLAKQKAALGIPEWVDIPESAVQGLSAGESKPFEFMVDPSAPIEDAIAITKRLQEAGCTVIN